VQEAYSYADWGSAAPSLDSPESGVSSAGARLVASYIAGIGDASYQYDEGGKLISKTEGGKTFSYSDGVGIGLDPSDAEMSFRSVSVADSAGDPMRTEIDYSPLRTIRSRGPCRKTAFASGKTVDERLYRWMTADNMESIVTEGSIPGSSGGMFTRQTTLIPDTATRTDHALTRLVQSETTTFRTTGSPLSVGIDYAYNQNGMLASYSCQSYGLSSSFSYNVLGELLQENLPNGISAQYAYDARGNLTMKLITLQNVMPGFSIRTYDSDDRLLTMSEYPGSSSFAYDSAGRPTKHKGKTVSWNGPRMTSYDGKSILYDGLGRILIVSDGSNIELKTYQEGRLQTLSSGGKTIEFVYGVRGDPIGFMYLGDFYYYHKNMLGDVLGIYRGKTAVARYVYDAWGNVLTVSSASDPLDTDMTSLGNINPFRYRGYCYEPSIKMYHLGSRFYDPEVGRFISPDDPGYLSAMEPRGLNLYAYCRNNPVMYADPTGHSVITAILIGLGVLAATGLGLMIGGRVSKNETLKNIGDSLISLAEIIAGILLITTGFGNFVVQYFAPFTLGTGFGSSINGYINMDHGGSFHAGWAGGQVAGILASIPVLGGFVGTFFGSVFTDSIDSDYAPLSSKNWKKAACCAAIAFGLSWFSNVIFLNGVKLSVAANLALSYNSAILGIANSIINVFWEIEQK